MGGLADRGTAGWRDRAFGMGVAQRFLLCPIEFMMHRCAQTYRSVNPLVYTFFSTANSTSL